MPLSSYAPQIVGSSVLMGLCFMIGRYNYSVLWIFILIAMNFMKSKLWKAKQKKEISAQLAARMEKQIVVAELENKLQDLPAWVQFPDIERVEWLNRMILQMWPYIGEYTKNFIKENIEPVVKQNLPGAFKSFKFFQMDMGDIPVRLGGMKVYTENIGRDKVIVDMDVAYTGDCEFVVGVGGFRGGMNNLQFKGKLRAIFKPLVPKPPLVGGITAHFLDAPAIDFNLTGLGEAVELPGLFGAIRGIVIDQVCKICVLPNSITIPLMENVDPIKLYFPMPDGVVRVTLVEAKNLENKDITFIKKGKSDPYAEIAVGAQSYRSKTIDDNLNPFWNETYEAIVDDSNGQKLVVELFDKDIGDNDEELGYCEIDLETIKQKRKIDEWFPLDNCKHGDVHLRVQWLFLSSNPGDLKKGGWNSQWGASSGDMTNNVGVLSVFVDCASDLPSPKKNLEPSAYVEVKLGSRSQRSYSKPKTRNPVFQQRFVFLTDDPENQMLNIEAKQENTGRSLGELHIPVKRLLHEKNMEIVQETFQLALGPHFCPIVITLRLLLFAE